MLRTVYIGVIQIDDMKNFLGRWKSDEGQSLWIIKIPKLNWVYAFYKPKKGRRICFMPCHLLDGVSNISISLHILGLMEAMLVLTPACSIEEKKDILIPELESGSETRWELDDWGFPWVYPLSIFQRV
jgi:hypothetical protein